jgi:Delta7-sterol 5-desaturase
VYGRLGVEVVSVKWQNKFPFKYINGPTSHSLHHRKYQGNFGLYVNWWDKWMGTDLKVKDEK